MPEIIREIDANQVADATSFVEQIAEPCQPVVLRGLINSWPAVHAHQQSPVHFQQYLSQFDAGKELEVFQGAQGIAGKYYYTDDLTRFNFERTRMRFRDALERIIAKPASDTEPSLYMGSVPTEDYLPGFASHNSLRFLKSGIAPRIWIGHASNVAAHYDTFDNVACVVAGERRFTLFAPQCISHLYVGPLDHTMAGQPVSLAASAAPDDERYPLFKEIRDQALTAQLGPGDAIYIPKLWWHQVEATSAINVLVNYWWDAFSVGPDAPATALLLSMITLCERPEPERQAWRAFFDHYVFRTNGHPLAHLPPAQHGILGPLQPSNYGRIRARIMQLLRGS